MEKRKEQVRKWYKEGTLDDKEADRDLRDIGKEINQITIMIATLVNKQPKRPGPLPVEDILNAATFPERRAVVVKLGLEFLLNDFTTTLNFGLNAMLSSQFLYNLISRRCG